MADLQLDHLATLLAVLDEGTFEAAAQRLHITASAVSQRIKSLEQSAGQVLVRRSNPAQATEAGALIVRYAQQVRLLGLDLERGLGGGADDAAADGGAPMPSLAVAVNADSLATWFLPAIADAHRELGVVFDIHREDQEFTAELLRSGSVLAAVTAEPRPVQGCTSVPLGTMRYRALATPGFRDRWMPGGALAELDLAPMVDYDRRDDLQQGFLRRLLGHPPRSPRHYIPTSDDFARAIGLGMGWGLLPDQQSAGALRSGELVDLAPERPIDIALHWQRWNLASALLDGVTRIVLDAAHERLAPATTGTRARR